MAEEKESQAEKKLGEEYKDPANPSARTLPQSSSTHIQSVKDYLHMHYCDAFVKKCKEGLTWGRDHPAATIGVTTAAATLLMRGSRKDLIRNTFGRFASEEVKHARELRVEKSMQDLKFSVFQMREDSRKIIERAQLGAVTKFDTAERLYTELMDCGNQLKQYSELASKIESQVKELVDELRDIPGEEALRRRREVVSISSFVKPFRAEIDKIALKISDLRLPD